MKRKLNESFEKHKLKRTRRKKLMRGYLSGRMIWYASNGTYVKKTHGLIGSDARAPRPRYRRNGMLITNGRNGVASAQ